MPCVRETSIPDKWHHASKKGIGLPLITCNSCSYSLHCDIVHERPLVYPQQYSSGCSPKSSLLYSCNEAFDFALTAEHSQLISICSTWCFVCGPKCRPSKLSLTSILAWYAECQYVTRVSTTFANASSMTRLYSIILALLKPTPR